MGSPGILLLNLEQGNRKNHNLRRYQEQDNSKYICPKWMYFHMDLIGRENDMTACRNV